MEQVVDPLVVGGFVPFGFEEVADDSSDGIASHIPFVSERSARQPVVEEDSTILGYPRRELAELAFMLNSVRRGTRSQS